MGGPSIDYHEMQKFYEERPHIKNSTQAEQVFKASRMHELFDPSKMKLPREACDSAASPHSRGIIFAEDVTGSMGSFLLSLIKNEFPRLIKLTYENVSFNPHIMFMGVGDVAVGDEAPLQVTQFETDLRILEQLQMIYLEKGGGSNVFESYILPWYFAGKFTKMDCYDKRGEKGFLFTFGDEQPTPSLSKQDIARVFGNQDSLKTRMISAEDCLQMASEKFNCYHIILPGYYYSNYPEVTRMKWRELLGGHACELTEHEYLPELVMTIFKMYEGYSKTEALNELKTPHMRRVVADALFYHEENVVTIDAGTTQSSDIEQF